MLARALVVIVFACLGGVARADEPAATARADEPAPEAATLPSIDDPTRRLSELLAVYASEERHERFVQGATGLATSSLTIGVGAFLLTERQQYGRTYVALAGWLNAGPPEYTFVRSLVALFLKGPMETLHRQAGAMQLNELELAWSHAARRARQWRYANAVIYGLFAAITLGYGGYLLFSRPLDNPVDEGQYLIGAELVLTGLGHTAHALHDVLVPSEVERSWRLRLTGAGTRAPIVVAPFAAATAGGAVAGVFGAF